MGTLIYAVRISDLATKMVEDISDVRVRKKIYERILKLAESPELQGRPLGDELVGYRSVRAVGQKYRIIYRVDKHVVTVLIVAVGMRRAKSKSDVYELTKRLLAYGLLEKPKKKRK